MNRHNWTAEQEQFIRDNCASLTFEQIGLDMPGGPLTREQVKKRAQKMGVSGVKVGSQKGSSAFPRKIEVERPVCKLLTCLFRDYATAPQKTVRVVDWEAAL